MSTTTCTHCNGWGTVCSRCGKPRRRKQKSWFESSGCGCYRAKLHSCPNHTQSSWSCDICGVARVGATRGDAYVGQIGSARLSVCNSCKAIADAAESVAVEQVLERRTGVANVAEAGERLVVERLRAELTWWREWGNRASQHLGIWNGAYTALEERAELRREAFTRGQVKIEDIEMGRVAPGTPPAPPVAHAGETGGEAVLEGAQVEPQVFQASRSALSTSSADDVGEF